MLKNIPSNFKPVVYAALVILSLLFILLIVKYINKVISKVGKQKKSKPNRPKVNKIKKTKLDTGRNTTVFSIFSYIKIMRMFSLKFKQMRLLKRVLKLVQAPTARILIINPEMAFYYFKQYFEKVFSFNLDKKEKDDELNYTIQMSKKFILEKNKIKKTKDIPLNTSIEITNELGGSFISKIIDVNSSHVLISIPSHMVKHISTLKDMILRVNFVNNDDAWYEFTTFVTEVKQIGNMNFFQLAHSEKIERKQRRKYHRSDSKIPATFYLLSVYKFEGKEKVMLHKKTMQSGYITNISEKGFCMTLKQNEAYTPNRLMKIEYILHGKKESVVGKIKSAEKLNMGLRLNVEIIKQTSSTRLNNSLFIYKLHPYFDNNVLIKGKMNTEIHKSISYENNELIKHRKLISSYAKVKMDVNDFKNNKPGLLKKITFD